MHLICGLRFHYNVKRLLRFSSQDEDQSDDDESSSATKETRVAEFIGQNMTALTKAAGAYSEGIVMVFLWYGYGCMFLLQVIFILPTYVCFSRRSINGFGSFLHLSYVTNTVLEGKAIVDCWSFRTH